MLKRIDVKVIEVGLHIWESFGYPERAESFDELVLWNRSDYRPCESKIIRKQLGVVTTVVRGKELARKLDQLIRLNRKSRATKSSKKLLLQEFN